MRTRRQFLQAASAVGATLALGVPRAFAKGSTWTEHRDLFPQGVASGDPHPRQRHPVDAAARARQPSGSTSRRSAVEIAHRSGFRASSPAARRGSAPRPTGPAASSPPGSAGAGYRYRFFDERGFGSRVGRTLTAPAATTTRPVRFAFVSCQDLNQGAITPSGA